MSRCRHCGNDTRLTPAERTKVLDLYREGYTRIEIVNRTGMSGKSVDRITATLRALKADDGQTELFKGGP